MATTASTLAGGTTAIADDEVEGLGAQLRGKAIGAEARLTFNAMHASTPAITAVCSGTADVIDAVRFARDHDLAVAVRGGGHSIAGLSDVDGGMLIDLSPMRGVEVDPDQRIARVQGGALWGDVDREAQAFGLVTPGGVVSDTGVAGLTLGGGYGWTRRKFGLSCDNVLEAQVVCADGQVRKASADSNADLYWALRGGGGNFGIVTSFTFKLHPMGPIVAFAGTFYPIEEVAQVLRGYREYVEQAPDEVTATCVTITFPADPEMPEAIHNRPCAIIGGVYTGDPEEGMGILQPLRELGTALADLSQPMPFTAVQAAFDPLFPRNEIRAYWKSEFLDELTDEAIDIVAGRAQDRPAPLTLVNTFHMGGAINRVAPDATAFAERSAKYMISLDGMWDDAGDDEANIAWIRDAHSRVRTVGKGSVYLNFTGRADEDAGAGVENQAGPNLRRLAEVKAKYDPDNFFRMNNNIAPA